MQGHCIYSKNIYRETTFCPNILKPHWIYMWCILIFYFINFEWNLKIIIMEIICLASMLGFLCHVYLRYPVICIITSMHNGNWYNRNSSRWRPLIDKMQLALAWSPIKLLMPFNYLTCVWNCLYGKRLYLRQRHWNGMFDCIYIWKKSSFCFHCLVRKYKPVLLILGFNFLLF